NHLLTQLTFTKIFFSTNPLKDPLPITSSIQHAYTQQIPLTHSLQKYLLIHSSKIPNHHFSSFSHLRQLNALLTDDNHL
ncbi:sugar phosphate isomerase family, partial [Staphylococcus epidermidis]